MVGTCGTILISKTETVCTVCPNALAYIPLAYEVGSCEPGSKMGLNSSTFARHAPLLGNMAPLNEEHFPAIQALNGKSGCKFNYRNLFRNFKNTSLLTRDFPFRGLVMRHPSPCTIEY